MTGPLAQQCHVAHICAARSLVPASLKPSHLPAHNKLTTELCRLLPQAHHKALALPADLPHPYSIPLAAV